MCAFKITRATFAAFLIILLAGCKPGGTFVSDAYRPDPEMLRTFIKDVYRAYPLPGIAVAVVTADTAYLVAQGYGDLEKKELMSDSTVFFAGSFSELIVTTAALRLQEARKLSLADKVVKHLPYFSMQGLFQEVSIHHLLTHTSGVPHFSPAWDMPAFDEGALEATTRSIVYQQLEFAPGSTCRRSPYNYDIAADLLSKVEGKPFEEVMEDRVLAPLGMSMSGFDPRDVPENRLAAPHHIRNWLRYDFERHEPYPYTRENAGSLGLHTTTRDMVGWMQMALQTGGDHAGFLSAESREELMRRCYKTGDNTYKGYGWDIVRSEDGLVYTNSWSLGGFSGDLRLFPGKKTGILVVSNTSDDFNPAVISSRIAHYLAGGEIGPVQVPVHIAMSRQLAGGVCLEEVLSWHDSLLTLKEEDHGYITGPLLLGQLGVNLLHRLSRREDALKVFQYCVEKYPDSPEAHLNLTEGLLASGLIHDANEHFRMALDLDGRLSTPYVNYLREQLTIAFENSSS